MATSCAIIVFLLIFAAEVSSISPNSLLQIDASKIVFELHKATPNRTVRIPRSTKNETALINASRPTIVIIHGWMARSNYTWVQNMTNLLLRKRYPCNVITVDWSSYSTSLNYPLVRLQIRQIGELVGNFVINITKNSAKKLANVHIIGHSLGAHAAGFAGQTVYGKLKEKIGRITALDAAGPLFELLPANARLSKDDAHKVDAIHTNGGVFGIRESYGTTDFFPNGGTRQAGCKNDSCSHSRAHELYIESVLSTKFTAVQCSSYLIYIMGLCNNNNKTIMGDNSPAAVTGTYYLTTNTKPPYGRGNWLP